MRDLQLYSTYIERDLKKIIIAVILFFSGLNLHAQNNELNNRLCIKIAPLSLLDIYSGMSPRLGLEAKLVTYYSVYFEAGTYIPNVNGMSDNTGYLGKLELKRYINKDELNWGPYCSGELFFKHQAYNTYDSIKSINVNYLKNYSVEKNIACITAKFGFFKLFESGFIIDSFIGLGLRNRNVKNSLTYEDNQNILQDGGSRNNIIKNQAGQFNTLNFDLGVKFGYRLK